ncbi:MAG: hypothetical protein BJ554DRAFT_3421, partial [Olpidium bornovanus]
MKYRRYYLHYAYWYWGEFHPYGIECTLKDRFDWTLYYSLIPPPNAPLSIDVPFNLEALRSIPMLLARLRYPPLELDTGNLRRTHHHPQQSGKSEDKLSPSPLRVVLSSHVASSTSSHSPLHHLPPVDRPPSLAFDLRMPSPRRGRRGGSGTPAPDPSTSAAEPPRTALPLAALSTAPSKAMPSTAAATTAPAPAVSSGEVDALGAAAAIPLPADEPMLDLPPRTVPVFGSVEVPLAPTIFSSADVDLTALSTLKRQHASTWHESATTTLGVECATVFFRDFAPAIDAVVADHSVSLADLTTALRELEPAVMMAATVYRRNHGTLACLRQTLTSATHRVCVEPTAPAAAIDRPAQGLEASVPAPSVTARHRRARSPSTTSSSGSSRRSSRSGGRSSSASSSSPARSTSTRSPTASPSPDRRRHPKRRRGRASRRRSATPTDAIPHGRRVRVLQWNNALDCGRGWLSWNAKFLSELALSGAQTEHQRLAELLGNVAPHVEPEARWTNRKARPVRSLREALSSLQHLYGRTHALDPRQLLRARVKAPTQGPQEPMQAYVAKGQVLVNEYIADREL